MKPVIGEDSLCFPVGRDVISVVSRVGGKILTDFLGGGQNMKKQNLCAKTEKSIFFEIRGQIPLLPHLNDVPACREYYFIEFSTIIFVRWRQSVYII